MTGPSLPAESGHPIVGLNEPTQIDHGNAPQLPEIGDATSQISQEAGSKDSVAASQRRKKKQKCRFYATKAGCRAGDSCQFLHDVQGAEAKAASATTSRNISTGLNDPKNGDGNSSRGAEKQSHPPQQQQTQDPKTFQVNQIVRRFKPQQETADNDTVTLIFTMPPSDPDFPFDLGAGLDCTLRIPDGFPKTAKPVLRVTNKDMERGYQINVENGFQNIWLQASNPTLLNAMKLLDKELEAILTGQKAETVKLVTNFTRDPPVSNVNTSTAKTPAQAPAAIPEPRPVKEPEPARPIISPERRAKAKAKRDTEVQILQHRLGRSSQFIVSGNGTLFTIPIEPRKRNNLPPSLQPVKTIQLLIPLEYDLEPCSIQLSGVEGEAAGNVLEAFRKRVVENPETTLLGHINYLAQNMHLMAVSQKNEAVTGESKTISQIPRLDRQDIGSEETETSDSIMPLPKDTDREHVKIIQRPPEWDNYAANEDDEATDDYDSEDGSTSEDGGHSEEDDKAEETTDDAPQISSVLREKGIMVSLPDLQLSNIELLELSLISLTVKCERCKDAMDILKVKPHSENPEASVGPGKQTEIRSASCKKCANPFSIGFRQDIMHANSNRAGYLDLIGCTVLDLLPSTFLPTCSDCSTPASENGGVVSVRGESSLAICRSCHRKLTFKIPEVKFLHIGPSSLGGLPLRQARRTKKESLGITAGTELPNRGRCEHYRKSYRWFRFSCCNAVYPCDRCHDAATDHPNEFANRMICGWCSREQHYRPEDCIHCHRGITGRAGSGFWEGGKGTRDRVKMSRKDPRKFKRRGGGAVGARYK